MRLMICCHSGVAKIHDRFDGCKNQVSYHVGLTGFNNIINNDSKRCVNLQFNFVASKRSRLKDVYDNNS